MHINKCTPPRAHPEVHISSAHYQVYVPKCTFLKCTFPKCTSLSAHFQVHIPQAHSPQCTSASAHSQADIFKCTFPSAHLQAHTPECSILKCTFPKCTVTQNRCAGRTGAIQPKVLANPTKDTSLIGCSWRSTPQYTELGSPRSSPKFTNAQKANR